MGVGHRNGRVGMFDKDVGGVRDGRKPEVAATAQLSDPRAFGRQQSRVCRGEGQQRLRRGWGQDWEEGYGERRGGGGGGGAGCRGRLQLLGRVMGQKRVGESTGAG